MRMSTGIHRSRAPTESKPSSPDEVAFLEDPHQGAEAGAEAEDVHDDGLDRHDDRAGHEEQQHEGGERRRRAAASGSRALSLALTSMSSAAMPPTWVSNVGGGRCGAGRRAPMRRWPCEVPAGTTSTTVDAGGVSGRIDGADDAGRASRAARTTRRTAGSVGVGVGDDGDGVGAACREPVGEGERDVRAPRMSGAGCGRRRSRSGRRGTARRAGRARRRPRAPTATAWPCTHRVSR